MDEDFSSLVPSDLGGNHSAVGLTRPTSTATTLDYLYISPDDYDYGLCVYGRQRASFLPPVYFTLFLVGLAGNSLVVWVLLRGVQICNTTDVCLLNLALADLLLVSTLPFLAYQNLDRWIFGDVMCKALLGVHFIVFYSGIFFITLMSIDRYLAIVHAVYTLKLRARSFGVVVVAVTWLAGFLTSFPELLYLKEQPSRADVTFCFPVYPSPLALDNGGAHFWRVFGLFKMNLLGLLVPAVVMTFCYSQIVRRLLSGQSPRRQTVRVVVTAVAVFFVCWVPYNVASFFRALELLLVYTECESSKAIEQALQVTEVVAFTHSCANPVLYVFVGQKFRRNLFRLVRRTPCALCRLVKVLVPEQHFRVSNISQTTSVDERSTAV
ncbi:C-C chemokine receptor type 1 [Syngnathoides biaculeatus]|uniref:C-C chemokine receptor type 1 n=1 Tax=Syngnathoides biaculeatus TaxID=300417 RepID=UPI002ADE33B6|nr:C-C chemokine receptor type 1 [Syngnathoides biaculeatus]